MSRRPIVIIVGGGFGGLCAAQALKSAPVDVTLIDRHNYHLFQPLLYQVATGSLSPGEIAAPLRSVLSRQKNTRVLLGEVQDIDPAIETRLARGRGKLRIRFADCCGGFAEFLLRPRNLASMGSKPEECGRGDRHPTQNSLRVRGRRTNF